MRIHDPGRMSAEELELLRRVSAAGADHAGLALSQLTGLSLDFTVARVSALPVDDVPALLGGAEAIVVALHLSIYGDTRGNILIALSPASAGRLLDAIVPGRDSDLPLSPREMSEMEQSGLLEMGNILAAAYLNAVSGCLRRSLLPSVPRLAVDMAGAVVDYLLIEITHGQDSALVIQTELRDRAGDVAGHILLLPDPSTLPHVLASLREEAT